MVLHLPTQIYLTCKRQSRSIVMTIIGDHITAIHKETIQTEGIINLTTAFVQRFNTRLVIGSLSNNNGDSY